MKLGDVPFDQLQLGDKLISCTGKRGYIAGLWREGETNVIGGLADYGGHILMLWICQRPTWSLTHHNNSQVRYLGSE